MYALFAVVLKFPMLICGSGKNAAPRPPVGRWRLSKVATILEGWNKLSFRLSSYGIARQHRTLLLILVLAMNVLGVRDPDARNVWVGG